MSVAVCSDAVGGGDPVWLDRVGQVTSWQHTKTFPGGCSSASFGFAAPANLRHRALNGGRTIRAYSGAALVFTGRLEQPVAGNPWQCTVTGNAALAKDYLAHNSGSNAAAMNNTIDAAITDGLPWTRTASLTNVLGQVNQYADTLDALLGTLISQGQYWALTDDGTITTPTGPPAVSLLLYATTLPPRTLNGYATAIAVTYVDSGGVNHTNVYTADAATLARYGTITQLVDVTNMGSTITSALAATIGNALLAKITSNGLPWSTGFLALPGQILTAGGVPVLDLATIDANITIRVLETNLEAGVTGTVDVPIGQIDYDDVTGQLTLTPLLAAQDSLLATLARANHLKDY